MRNWKGKAMGNRPAIRWLLTALVGAPPKIMKGASINKKTGLVG